MVVKAEVCNDGEQWCARANGADFFTCARSLDELPGEVKDAAACHFEEELHRSRVLDLVILTEAEILDATAAPTAADRR